MKHFYFDRERDNPFMIARCKYCDCIITPRIKYHNDYTKEIEILYGCTECLGPPYCVESIIYKEVIDDNHK
jgi:hypothetical protein